MPLERVAGRPTWLLSRTNLRAQDLLAAAFATEGLRGYHFRLLAALDQYGPSSQADLGRHTGIDRSDVVAALNELVDKGLARRQPDPADGRRNVVSIKKRGKDHARTSRHRARRCPGSVARAVVAEGARDL